MEATQSVAHNFPTIERGIHCVYIIQLDEALYKYGRSDDYGPRMCAHRSTFTKLGYVVRHCSVVECRARSVELAVEDELGRYGDEHGIKTTVHNHHEILRTDDIQAVIEHVTAAAQRLNARHDELIGLEHARIEAEQLRYKAQIAQTSAQTTRDSAVLSIFTQLMTGGLQDRSLWASPVLTALIAGIVAPAAPQRLIAAEEQTAPTGQLTAASVPAAPAQQQVAAPAMVAQPRAITSTAPARPRVIARAAPAKPQAAIHTAAAAIHATPKEKKPRATQEQTEAARNWIHANPPIGGEALDDYYGRYTTATRIDMVSKDTVHKYAEKAGHKSHMVKKVIRWKLPEAV